MPESGNTKSVFIIAQRRPERHQFGICRKHAVLQRAYITFKYRDFKGLSCHQIGITFPGATVIRRGMNNQGGAQGNAVVRSHCDTGISDASGVKSEAPKGG